ncbi:Carbonate dehydratase eukaryotic-type [Trichostrongylus colubriformis]|uniref:Carbonic anhydrase n=1 Tax=Trichostrongylus colubriformis TaxID=6319 RepID=A0AAN8FG35_TRICO
MFQEMPMIVFLLTFLFEGIEYSGGEEHWGYREGNGPENWGKSCQDGFRQVRFVGSKLEFLISVAVNGFDNWGTRQPYIQGGGLKHRYQLVQFHLHWAQHDHLGSEHKMGGLHYPAELHLVHVRQGLTVQEAIKKPDGVAVVGVFLVIGHDGSSMSSVSSVLESVVFPGNQSTVQGFRTRPMLPAQTEAFYRYEGSLTTPDCDEAVIWTILAEPVSVTRSQVSMISSREKVSKR